VENAGYRVQSPSQFGRLLALQEALSRCSRVMVGYLACVSCCLGVNVGGSVSTQQGSPLNQVLADVCGLGSWFPELLLRAVVG